MPKINSLEVVHQDTNADKFDNLHDLLVKFKKFYDESANREVVDADARAAYEALMEMYVNDKEAFAKRIETLSAKFGDSLAQVVEEMLAYASKSEAWAKKISTVEAELGNAKASVETETYARVTEDEALASQITTVESSLGTEIASVQTYAESLATTKNRTFRQTSAPTAGSGRIAGDLWFDTDDNNKSYRFDGVSWVATDDTRIATTYARWGVQVDAGGNVAGIQLNSSGVGSSNFIVLADNFKVYRSGYTSAPIFTTGTVNGVATVGIKGNLVVDGSIITAGLANNSVSIPASQQSSNAVNGNGGVQIVNQINHTLTSAGSVLIVFNGRQNYDFGARNTSLVLYINGAEIVPLNIAGAINDYANVSWSGNLNAGTNVIQIGWYGQDGSVRISNRTLSVLGTMR